MVQYHFLSTKIHSLPSNPGGRFGKKHVLIPRRSMEAYGARKCAPSLLANGWE